MFLVNFRVYVQSHIGMQTIMDDELIQVKAKMAATKIELATAETDKDRELVLTLTNLLVRLCDEKARVEARLSPGEMHYNRGEHILCGFNSYNL
jgi:hypothetical protein